MWIPHSEARDNRCRNAMVVVITCRASMVRKCPDMRLQYLLSKFMGGQTGNVLLTDEVREANLSRKRFVSQFEPSCNERSPLSAGCRANDRVLVFDGVHCFGNIITVRL